MLLRIISATYSVIVLFTLCQVVNAEPAQSAAQIEMMKTIKSSDSARITKAEATFEAAPKSKISVTPSADNQFERGKIIGFLEAKAGVDAAKLYMKNYDDNAGGDKVIDVTEAPEFAKNAIGGRFLAKMHEYDVNFQSNAQSARGYFSILGIKKTVKSRGDYAKDWKEIVCEKGNPYFIVKEEAKMLGFTISDEVVKAGVAAACPLGRESETANAKQHQQADLDQSRIEQTVKATRELMLSAHPSAPEMVFLGSFSVSKYEVTQGQNHGGQF